MQRLALPRPRLGGLWEGFHACLCLLVVFASLIGPRVRLPQKQWRSGTKGLGL
jgi:hypothetical protein